MLKQQLYLPYGGLHLIFAGDMRQLKPCRQLPVYADDCIEFKDWVNCFIELEGMHQFKDIQNGDSSYYIFVMEK